MQNIITKNPEYNFKALIRVGRVEGKTIIELSKKAEEEFFPTEEHITRRQIRKYLKKINPDAPHYMKEIVTILIKKGYDVYNISEGGEKIKLNELWENYDKTSGDVSYEPLTGEKLEKQIKSRGWDKI